MALTVFVADLASNKVSAAVLDREGKILLRRVESLDLDTPLAPVKQVERIASELAQARSPYNAIGIAVAGLVRRDGSVYHGDLPGWEKVPLARMLHAKLHIPVVVERSYNAAALGEAWRGAGRGTHDVVVLSAGNSVGAGIISGGKLVRGAHDLSGSAGWMAVSEADGYEVRKFGLLDAFASEPAIVRAGKNALAGGLGGPLAEYEVFSAEDIAELARRGDVTCKQIYRRAGKLLGLAIANMINLFDPEVVVFGGSLSSASDLFWDELTHTAQSRCHPIAARRVKIRLSGLGGDANLHGVGYLAWQAAHAGASPGNEGQPSAKKLKKKLPLSAQAVAAK